MVVVVMVAATLVLIVAVIAAVVVVVVVANITTICTANMTMYKIHPFGNLHFQQFQLLPRAITIMSIALDTAIGD